MSILSKAFHFVSKLIGVVLKPLSDLLSSLVKIPKTSQTPQADPVYTVATSNEVPKPGDPKPVLAGQPVIYPLLLSAWSEYTSNKQTLHLYFYVAYGLAGLRELQYAGAPVSTVGSYQMQELPPGTTGTLANHSVYVNEDANGIELTGGALDIVPFDCNITFAAAGGVTVNSDDDVFDDLPVGGRFTVVGTASNDVEYTVATKTDARNITVTPAPTDETSDCTVNVYQVSTGGSSSWVRALAEIIEGDDESSDPSIVTLTFDSANSTIKAPMPESWSDFRVGDLIQAYRSSNNDGIDYQIVAFSGEYAIVEPAPNDAVDDECSVTMVRRRVGPFPLCAPGQKIEGFLVNFLAEQGIYKTNKKGKLRTVTVGVEMQIELVDDAGNPLAPIQSLGEIPISGATNTPQHRTKKYLGLAHGRYQGYLARTTPANDDTGRADALQIESLVGFVVPGAVDPHYDATGTRLMIDVTATSAVPSGAENKFRGRWQAYYPLLDTETDEWSEPQATNDIAPFWAQLRRWGGFDVDLDAYKEADAAWRAAAWEFHVYMTGATTKSDATKDVLLAGDARPWYKWTKNADSMWRDRQRDIATWCLHDGNVARSTMNERPFGLIPEDTPTGIIAQYTDPQTGEDREVKCGDCDVRPETVKYTGVISRQQAFELGNRELRRRKLRVQVMSATTMWIHRGVDFGEPTLIQSLQHRMGQIALLTGGAGTTLIVDREFEWSPTEAHSAWIVDAEGVPSQAYPCSRGIDDRTLILESAPDPLNYGEDGGDPSVVLLGYEGHSPRMGLAAGITASDSEQHANINVVLDDDAIFESPGDAPADEYPITGEAADLTISDLAASIDGMTITATWTRPAAATSCIVEYRLSGALTWTPLPPVAGGTASVTVAAGGTYEVHVRALGPAGTIGPQTDPALAVIASPALDVTVPRTTVDTTGYSSALISEPVPATIVGGVAPVVGAWSLVSGSSGVTPQDAGDPASRFQATLAFAGATTAAVYRYDATDAAANAASCPDVAFTFTRPSTSGPSCPHVDSWLPGKGRAGDVAVGELLLLTDPETGETVWGEVTYSQRELVPCVRIFTASATLICSTTAPIPTRTAGEVLAPDLSGHEVPVRVGLDWQWEAVTAIQSVGDQPVQHITVGDRCFWAGERRGASILHHNKIYTLPL